MNPEERARKWRQDVPELCGLTLQQRIAICNQVSKRIVFLVVLWLTLFFVVIFVILSSADTNSALYNLLNHTAETINTIFNGDPSKRYMVALLESLPYILPMLVVLVGPIWVMVTAFRKLMLFSAARKL
ncbi:hypothetical protein [uncultured Solobacterium sp.]|jgi:hypothetical protein|uniref:hypothetical protein n=1 Tax=uncultured Solobacterium sp. TaxID=747375 RepID=UPI0025E0C7BE|nr:hypothetical protein [uncultured Solobacterium sp.]